MSIQGLWTATTSNRKTGPVPTLAVGATREQSLESCRDCGLLKGNREDNKGYCYAQHGTPAMAHAQMVKTNREDPTRYTFERAMGERYVSARMVRFGSIGDPASIDHDTLRRWIDYVIEQGMSVVGYTHHWRDPANQWLRDHFMASCDTLEQVDEAIKMGWSAAVVTDQDWNSSDVRASDGSPYMLCPAIASARKAGTKLTCNDCRLCDVKRNRQVIVFPNHGPARRRK